VVVALRLPAAVLAALILVTTGCGREATAERNSIPWVLPSPGAIAVPADGATPAPDPLFLVRAATRQERVDEAGSYAVQPWLELAMALIARRPKDPVGASRAYALVAVAMHDAAIAAEHWNDVHGGSASQRSEYPAVRAAIAGAASRVLAYAFPEHPAARLDQQADDASLEVVAAGAAGQPAAAAGLELGREVAERVIARARQDGAERKWKGEVPRFRGAWRPPPGSAARPVAPLAGSWRTWVLPSGDALRPPPPPGYASRRYRAEAQEVLDVHRRLTTEQKRVADFWAGEEGTELPPGRWLRVTLEYLRHEPRMSEASAARVMALLAVAMADAGIAAWDAKYAYWTTRPENAIRDLGLHPSFKPYLDTPFFPAYVSGHAVYSGAAAEVLAHLFPGDADMWRRRAQEAALSRVYGGIHFPMDSDVGLPMGEQIGRLVVKRDAAQAATE
jgi:hypothetical protein